MSDLDLKYVSDNDEENDFPSHNEGDGESKTMLPYSFIKYLLSIE